MDVDNQELTIDPNSLAPGIFNLIEEFCSTLVTTLNALESAIRQLHPPALPEITRALEPFGRRFLYARVIFFENPFPEPIQPFIKQLKKAADHIQETFDGLINAFNSSKYLSKILSAIVSHCRAQELIYPAQEFFPPVSRYFLEASVRKKSKAYCITNGHKKNLGLLSLTDRERSGRNCYLYVPESYDESRALPLVIALHGGSGSGREFIWSWLREARTRRFVLMSPSSAGRTWSFNSNHDYERIFSRTKEVMNNYNISREKVLLTGFSDGAIYTLTCGLMEGSPFTVLAPISGILHPQNLKNARGRRIYMVHGALDWLFSIQHAENAYNILKAYEAEIVLHKIANLSHAYPREQNDRILTWFDPELSLESVKTISK